MWQKVELYRKIIMIIYFSKILNIWKIFWKKCIVVKQFSLLLTLVKLKKYTMRFQEYD